ncbi:hypothetical protein J4Q44_G00229490 [Coregonus suidteri]|uniref:Uncharacterized protein n=1 Tax=Coregonus suidteri TaxID=861788 RepID=A0AAN8L5H3_9TELE
MEDLRILNKQLKSPKRPVSPSSPDQMPTIPMESPSQRYEARIEEGKLYYDKRWYMHTNYLPFSFGLLHRLKSTAKRGVTLRITVILLKRLLLLLSAVVVHRCLIN